MTAPPSEPAASAGESHFEHTALFEFSKVINSSDDLGFILSHILLTIMGKIVAPRGLVALHDSDGHFRVRMVKGFPAGLRDRILEAPDTPERLTHLDRLDPVRFPWAVSLRGLGADILLPMMAADGPIGFLCFGGRPAALPLREREHTYLDSLANISATAIQKTHHLEEARLVNRKLDGKIQELNTLFELGKEFSAVLDPDSLVRLLVFSIMGQIGVSRYLVGLARGADMVVAAARLDGPPPQGELLRLLTRLDGPATVDDLAVRRGIDQANRLRELGIRVVVPMSLQGECRGLLLLGEKLSREPFARADLDLVSSLGNLAIISLENARLFQEAIEKQKLEDELQIAREIQKGLLPSVLPEIPGLDLAARNVSSRQVGGDYYDVITLEDGRVVIAIGDVSGKGTPASLLMANLQATIRALVTLPLPLGELTMRVNDLMCENTGSDRFITFFWGILDPAHRRLITVNAGHNYPFLLRADGRVERLEKGGMILGVMPSFMVYEQETTTLAPGDLLVLFTDGVSEALNRAGEEYSEGRLEQLLLARQGAPAADLIEAVQEDVAAFTRGAPQSDDITLMVLRAV